MKRELVTVALDRDEADAYERALTMLSPDEGQPRAISRATVDALIQEAILTSLDIYEKQAGVDLDTRIGKSIQTLRDKLNAPIVEWQIWQSVDRLKVPPEGFTLGKVLFCDSTHQSAQQAKAAITETLKPHPTPLPPDFFKSYWPDEFSTSTLCCISVLAGDSTAAGQIADVELQTTMSVLNFFASLVSNLEFMPAVCISGIFSSYKTHKLKFRKAPQTQIGWSGTVHRLAAPFDISEFNRHLQIKAALEKINALLCTNEESELRDRLLTAVKWAGKGAATESTEDSYLFYAIALETLLLGSNRYEQLSYKLRLRAARLLGLNTQGRVSTRDSVNRLYILRSKMVHSGKTQIPRSDLSLLRIITQSCVIHLLSADMFKDIQTDDALEQWFECELMSGRDETKTERPVTAAQRP